MSERALRNTCLVVFILLIGIGLIGPSSLLIAPSRETKRDFAVRKFIRDQFRGLSPLTTVAVLEKAEESDILSRWYLHEGPHRLMWNVEISRLRFLTPGPLLIVSSRIEIGDLQQRIANEMGAEPDRSANYVAPKEVAYAAFFYAYIGSLPRAAGGGVGAQAVQFVAKLFDGVEELVMPHIVLGGRFLDESDGAGRFENAAVHFREGSDSLPMCGRDQFRARHQFPVEMISQNPAAAHEIIAASLDQQLQFFMPVNETDNQVIGQQQRCRAHQAAGDRIVVSDDRVLNRIGKSEQNDQIERIELRQFAFAGDSQADE